MTETAEDSSYLGPVTVASHPWCRISHITYYIWVKDKTKIDLTDQEPLRMASGVSDTMCTQWNHLLTDLQTLFPDLDMGPVDVMICTRLLKIWDTIFLFAKKLDPNEDTTALETAAIQWDFNWCVCQLSIANAAKRTAYEWFKKWFTQNFRGTKWPSNNVDNPLNSHHFVITMSGLTTLSVPHQLPTPSTHTTRRSRQNHDHILLIPDPHTSITVSDPEDHSDV